MLNQTIRNSGYNTTADVLNRLSIELPKIIKAQEKDATIHDGINMTMCAFKLTNPVMYFSATQLILSAMAY